MRRDRDGRTCPATTNRRAATVRERKEGERGFALLLVFLLAGAIALMLYQQMPRVAFESQREKEQVLIDRGEQYKRAIQLYFIAFKKYPSKIEDLENTNNQRFLRKRYIDPMTGKDEWRLVHINAGGQYTDSLTQKPPTPADPNNPNASANGPNVTNGTSTTSPNGSTASNPSSTLGPDGQPLPPQVNAAVLQRPSDRPLVGNGSGITPPPADPNDPNANFNFNTPFGTPATTPPGTPGAQPPTGLNGQFTTGQFNPNQTGQAPQFPGQFPGQLPGQLPGQFAGQLAGQLQAGASGQNPLFPGALPGQPLPPGGAPGIFGATPGNPASGMPGAATNPALAQIQTMLTTPRQPPSSTTSSSNVTGGGVAIAGVASTFTGPSIKVYKDHQKYQEWEFLFDLKNDAMKQMGQQTNPAQQGTNPAQGQTLGQTSGQTSGPNPGQSMSPFGQTMGAGPGATSPPTGNPNNNL